MLAYEVAILSNNLDVEVGKSVGPSCPEERVRTQASPSSRPQGCPFPFPVDITWFQVLSLVRPGHVDLKDTFEVFPCIGNPHFQGEMLLPAQYSLVFSCCSKISLALWVIRRD